MSVRYRIDIENPGGNNFLSLTNFLTLDFDWLLNDKGSYILTLSGFEPDVELIEEDAIIRVWMADPVFGIDWLNVFNGVHKTFVDSFLSNGNQTWTSYGPSLEEIVDKEEISYAAGSSQANKSAVATTVMYEFVRENVGDLATVANGRRYDATNPIFNGPDLAQGPNWSGGRSQRRLLNVLQEIHEYSVDEGDQVDFRVDYLENYQFRFMAGKLGIDRTATGLTSGLNAAGNVPVILGPRYGNVRSATRSKPRYNEVNTIIALGRGRGTNRRFQLAKANLAAAVSPIAQRSASVNVAGYGNLTDDDILAEAQARLDAALARESLSVEPRKANDAAWINKLPVGLLSLEDLRAETLWKDYFPGDFVTTEDFRTGVRFNQQLQRVSVQVRPSNTRVETIRMGFVDV